jgi:phosphonate transport system permease protein
LRAQGASRLGVFRFALLPQALPRLTDGLIYRLEHNLRAATTLGVVGAGGFGLEIVTAFHLFEYREAAALILVLLALITAVNFFGAGLRRMMLRGT